MVVPSFKLLDSVKVSNIDWVPSPNLSTKGYSVCPFFVCTVFDTSFRVTKVVADHESEFSG